MYACTCVERAAHQTRFLKLRVKLSPQTEIYLCSLALPCSALRILFSAHLETRRTCWSICRKNSLPIGTKLAANIAAIRMRFASGYQLDKVSCLFDAPESKPQFKLRANHLKQMGQPVKKVISKCLKETYNRWSKQI